MAGDVNLFLDEEREVGELDVKLLYSISKPDHDSRRREQVKRARFKCPSINVAICKPPPLDPQF